VHIHSNTVLSNSGWTQRTGVWWWKLLLWWTDVDHMMKLHNNSRQACLQAIGRVVFTWCVTVSFSYFQPSYVITVRCTSRGIVIVSCLMSVCPDVWHAATYAPSPWGQSGRSSPRPRACGATPPQAFDALRIFCNNSMSQLLHLGVCFNLNARLAFCVHFMHSNCTVKYKSVSLNKREKVHSFSLKMH